MMYPSEARLTRFEGVFDNLSEWDETLCSFVEIIRAGRYTSKRGIDEKFRKKILKYRNFLSSGDLKNYSDGKKKLMGVTLAGVFREGRKDEHLVRYSGLVHVDLDKLQVEQVEEYRKILQEDPCVLVVFISASGRGLKVICWHPLGPEHHQDVYFVFKMHVQQLLKCDDDVFDDVVLNLSRLCFVSHDPYAFLNPYASPIVSSFENLCQVIIPAHDQLSDLSNTAEEPKAKSLFDLSKHTIIDEGLEQKYGAAVLDANCEKIRGAVNGQKHDTRLKQARTVAGYVAGGYIEESVAMERLISAALDNTDNPKLAEKDIRAGFQHGLLEPLEVPLMIDSNQQFSTNGHAGTAEIEGLQVREADPYLDQKLKKVKEVAEEFTVDENEEEKVKKPNPLLSFDDFVADLAAPDYLIEDMIESESLITLIGDPGVGKSFMALSWGLAVATGMDWQDKPVKQGNVYYFAGEGKAGMKRRMMVWKDHHGRNPGTAFRCLAGGWNLTKMEEVDRLNTEIIEEIVQSDGQPAMIIVDTLARHFGADDENSTQAMTKFIHYMDVLRNHLQCTVIIVHHTGKDKEKGGRGSSALHAAIDAGFLIEKPNSESGSTMTLKCLKMKDGEMPAHQFYQLQLVDVRTPAGHLLVKNDGHTPFKSCVLSSAEEPQFEADDAGKKPKDYEIKAYDAFLELWEKGKRNLLESGRNLVDLSVDSEEWSDLCRSEKYGLTKYNVYDVRLNRRDSFQFFHDRVSVKKKHLIKINSNDGWVSGQR